MLYIDTKTRTGIQWHIGEPCPQFKDIDGRVFTFQADGDELHVILEAIRKRSNFNYTKKLDTEYDILWNEVY